MYRLLCTAARRTPAGGGRSAAARPRVSRRSSPFTRQLAVALELVEAVAELLADIHAELRRGSSRRRAGRSSAAGSSRGSSRSRVSGRERPAERELARGRASRRTAPSVSTFCTWTPLTCPNEATPVPNMSAPCQRRRGRRTASSPCPSPRCRRWNLVAGLHELVEGVFDPRPLGRPVGDGRAAARPGRSPSVPCEKTVLYGSSIW